MTMKIENHTLCWLSSDQLRLISAVLQLIYGIGNIDRLGALPSKSESQKWVGTPPTTHQKLLIGPKGDRCRVTSHVIVQCSYTTSDGPNGLLPHFSMRQPFVQQKLAILEDDLASQLADPFRAQSYIILLQKQIFAIYFQPG